MEAERPCCYTECCDADASWDEYGMRIRWTEPLIPGATQIIMLEPLNLKLCLECKKPVPLRYVTAWAWTHIFHQDNPEGIYREIKLAYDEHSRKWDDWGVTTYEFSAVIYPAHYDVYRLTFNVKYGKVMIWANLYKMDHILTVLPAKEVNMWTKVPRMAQITPKIYLGNFLSVMLADEDSFDAVLNLHPETESKIRMESTIIQAFKTVSVKCGAGNELSVKQITDIVDWLMDANRKYQKILVGGHDSQGRVGSAMTAYIFANNRNLTFDEAYNFVKSRMTLYCHKGLKDTLYELYPRD